MTIKQHVTVQFRVLTHGLRLTDDAKGRGVIQSQSFNIHLAQKQNLSKTQTENLFDF